MGYVEIPASPTPFTIGSGIGVGGSSVMFEGGVSGLGMPSFDTSTSPRYLGDGVAGGRQSTRARTVTVTAWSDSQADLVALSALMAPRPDPTDTFPLTLVDIVVPGRRSMWVRPDGFDFVYDEESDQSSVTGIRLVFLAEDPIIYSADETLTSSGSSSSHVFEVTNAGTFEARRGRSWRLAFTGAVSNPWVEIDSRRVLFPVSVGGGQVLTVDEDRQTWLGSERISGLPRTPGQHGPDWPTLPPGVSTVTAGGSGSFSVSFWSRSTWL